MRVIELQQGSPEWLAHRAKERNASEAPAMMGVSKYQTRSALLKAKATGITPEVDVATQRRFDEGHRTEALARAIVEEMIGEELYPVVGVSDDGYLAASFDGITMDGSTGFEHKLWNVEFAEQVRNDIVPETHIWQLEQQIIVGGLEKIIFVCSDGTRDNFEWLEYRSDAFKAAQLIAGWKAFDEDLDNYQHAEAAPTAVAAPIQDLPALNIQISGSVAASNLAEWKDVVVARIADINTDLQTDQHFADAEKTTKFLAEGEKRIDVVKAQAQAQASDIDVLFRAMDEIKAMMKQKRLELEKLVAARKENIRIEIVKEHQALYAEHTGKIQNKLGSGTYSLPTPDFMAAIKGKKTVTSLREAAGAELLRVKLAASEYADKVEANMKLLRELIAGNETLFPDIHLLAVKDGDAITAIAKQRIAEHEHAVAAKAKADAEAAEQARVEAERKAAAAACAANKAPASQPLAPVEKTTPVAAIQPRDDGARIKLGDINAAIAPLTITQSGLSQLGFEAAGRERTSTLYKASDLLPICQAIISRMSGIAFNLQRKAA